MYNGNRPSNEIAAQNDTFRKSVLRGQRDDGKAIMTRGVAALPGLTRTFIFSRILNYIHWDIGTDPHGEHDFGVIQIPGVPKIYWKIDYYEDSNMEYGTEEKSNCYRVLVIMLASEY